MTAQALLNGTLKREYNTVKAMVEIYCKAHHRTSTPMDECEPCREFLDHVSDRLDRCSYGQDKPSCKQCAIHCYRPEMKARARAIMIFSGPKMLFSHPIMAIRHLIHSRKRVPTKPSAGLANRQLRKQSNK